MKTVVKVVGIVVVLLIVVAIALPFLVNVNNFRPQIESNLSSALGRPVKVGNLGLSIFSGSVEADQLSIADDPKFSSAPFIQAKSLRVGVELLPLIFSKHLNVTKIVIDHPRNHSCCATATGSGISRLSGTSPAINRRKPASAKKHRARRRM